MPDLPHRAQGSADLPPGSGRYRCPATVAAATPTRSDDPEPSGTLIVDLHTGAYHRLEGTGTDVWTRLIDRALTVDQTVDEIVASYAVGRAQVEADVARFVRELLANGLIEPATVTLARPRAGASDTPPAPPPSPHPSRATMARPGLIRRAWNRLLRWARMPAELPGVWAAARGVERSRTTEGAGVAIAAARDAAAQRPRRSPNARQALGNVIGVIERLRFRERNCFRRVLWELRLDRGAAAETVILGFDEQPSPITDGPPDAAPSAPGHAWLESQDEAHARNHRARYRHTLDVPPPIR